MFRRHPPLKDLRVYDLETFWGVKQTTFRKEEKKSSGGGRYPTALEPLKRLKRLEEQILNRPTVASELEKELNEESKGEPYRLLGERKIYYIQPPQMVEERNFTTSFPPTNPKPFVAPAISWLLNTTCPYGIPNHNCDENTKHNKVMKSIKLTESLGGVK